MSIPGQGDAGTSPVWGKFPPRSSNHKYYHDILGCNTLYGSDSGLSLSLSLSIYLFIYLSIDLSIYPAIYLSISLSRKVVFCCVFLSELVFRLYFHGLMFFQMVGRGWNTLDFCIVIISVVDTFILMPIGFGGSARFISMLRFVRLMRLVRLVRLFRIFKELWLVANGLLNVLRTLIWICFLIFLICFICGIFCTRWIGHNDKLYDAYFVTSGGWDHEERGGAGYIF